MKKYLKSLILGSLLLSLTGAHALELNYSSTQVHLQELKEWKQTPLNQKSSIESVLDNLSRSTHYGHALAELYEEQLPQGGLQPYSLNLIKGYFEVVIMINSNLQERDNSLENVTLKALSLESVKKINDLFFHPTILRGLMKDQFASNPHLKKGWEAILKKNERSASKIESILKKNSKKMNFTSDALQSAWDNSLSQKLIAQGKKLSELTDTELTLRNISDSLSAGLGSIATGASSAFGAIAGNIAWREGYLKDDEKLLSDLNETLLPFDLLMEKKAFKFTDKTIPGHWGHVGVYLGSKDQLMELGLWDHPSILPFKENIEKGKTIFQVRRWGLVFDSLRDFVNLDEMAVLRVDGFAQKSKNELSQTLDFLADQLDKEYDFSFDAMTGETITCTEIIAFSFGPISWPMEELLGRLTISPNNLAELAFYTGTPLKTVMYATGDEQGLHYHSKDDFAKTLSFYERQGVYQKHSLKCKREHYRHRRDGLRFRYSCEDSFKEYIYP